ncbi:MAG: CAP domain-containing protein [Solirubrobacterales bacterium]
MLGSPREIFKAWMNSPLHRAAILNGQYRELGVGFRMGSLGGFRRARIWVEHFGTLC